MTLEGTKADWESIRTRLDKLLTFGNIKKHPDLYAWHSLLVPIVTNLVDAFDEFHSDPQATTERAIEIRNFFQYICSVQFQGSGSNILTGWITFLCAFSDKGRWMLIPKHLDDEYRQMDLEEENVFGKKGEIVPWEAQIDLSSVPNCYGEVGVKIIDNGVIESTMIAGMVGYTAITENKDTLQPFPGWFIFTKDPEMKRLRDEKARQRRRWMT